MKTKSILLILFSLSIVFTSCSKNNRFVKPSGNVTTKTMSVSNISKLDFEGPYNITVSISSDDESVVIEADDNLHQYIEKLQIGDRLVVKFSDDITLKDYDNATLNFNISMKTLVDIYGAGATNFDIIGDINTESFNVELSGASNLNASLNVSSIISALSGASGLNISGSTDNFEIIAEGACEMSGFDFITNNLDADLEGASNMNLTVNNKLDVKASGASNIYFMGNGIINSQKLSGGSKIVKME